MYATRKLPEKDFILSPEYKAFLPFHQEYLKSEILAEEQWLSKNNASYKKNTKDAEYAVRKKRLASLKHNLIITKNDLRGSKQTRRRIKGYVLEKLAIMQYLHGGVDRTLEEEVFGANPKPSSGAKNVIVIQDIHNQNDTDMSSAMPTLCMRELGFGSIVVALEGQPTGQRLDRYMLVKGAEGPAAFAGELDDSLLESIRKANPQLYAAIKEGSISRDSARAALLTVVHAAQYSNPEIKITYTGIE